MKIFGIEIYTELDEPKYWIHLFILAGISLGVLQIWKGGEMLTVMNVVYSVLILALSDTIAHSLLKLR